MSSIFFSFLLIAVKCIESDIDTGSSCNLIYLIYSILLGRICCPEGKGTTGLQGPLQGAPPHPPSFHIRKTATATGITLLLYE